MEKLFSKIKKETLTTDEKSQMVLNLNKYVDANPVENISFNKRLIKSPFYSTVWTLSKQRTIVLPVTAALIFVLTSGTVLASNTSLPGDTLYPVKKFNESVQSAVALGTKAKTKVSTEHAVSRLEEAKKLASRGDLTEEKALKLEVEFQKHFEKIEKNIEKLKNEGDDVKAEELLSVFEDSVSLQNDDIDKLSEDLDLNDDTRENLKNLRSVKTHVESEINRNKKDHSDDEEDEEEFKQDEDGVKTRGDSEDRDSDEYEDD